MPTPVRPERGRIIWANISDKQGRNLKLRPAVVLTTAEEIEAGEPIVVAVVSTQFQLAKPEDQVELPWAPLGNTLTRLKKRCVAVCNWVEEIKESDISEYGGMVPAAELTAILTRVSELMGGQESDFD